MYLVAAREVVVLGVCTDPVPDVHSGVLIDHIDCPVTHRDANGATARLVAASLIIFQVVKPKRRVTWICQELFKTRIGELPDFGRKRVQKLAILGGTAVLSTVRPSPTAHAAISSVSPFR